jgi:phospholipid transport system substrate-binding protein
MKKLLTLFFIMTGLLFATQIAFANDGNPIDMVQSLANRMVDNLKANKASLKTNPAKAFALTYKIVVPHADIAEMSKRVLPPQIWNNATASQRAKFEGEFTKLLIRTYASALSDYDNQTLRFFPVRGGYQGKSTITVVSQIIRSDGSPIAVNYSLISKPSGWKLYDMTVEGISLLESFRSQFADKLSQGNMDSLISEIEKHNIARSGS